MEYKFYSCAFNSIPLFNLHDGKLWVSNNESISIYKDKHLSFHVHSDQITQLIKFKYKTI